MGYLVHGELGGLQILLLSGLGNGTMLVLKTFNYFKNFDFFKILFLS